MLKQCLLSISLVFGSTSAWAQNYLDGVISKSCECMQTISDTETRDVKDMQLGLCMLKSFSEEDKVKFKKEFNLDVNNPVRDGHSIGSRLGTRLATACPDQLIRLSRDGQKDGSESRESVITGKINKIETSPYVTFVVKDGNNVLHRLSWITRISSSLDISANYLTYVGKSLTFKFDNKDLFDPRISDYRSVKVITEIRQD